MKLFKIPDLGLHPYYSQKLVNQLTWYHITCMSYFIFRQVWLSIRLCLGHYDPSGGKPPGQFFLCRHRDCILWYMRQHWTIHDGSHKVFPTARWQQIKVFLLPYYKALHGPKYGIVSLNRTVSEVSTKLLDQASSPCWREVDGSSGVGSASSSPSSGWKSVVVQSIWVKAWKTASSLLRSVGSTTGV